MTALRLAHRGDWRHAPENSVAAMVAALAIPGCDGLEFDVRGSRDGVPVLLHDPTLTRVQGVEAAVDTLDAADLARHGVPALAEVLRAVGREPFLDVELKSSPVPAVIDVLETGRGGVDAEGRSTLVRAVVSSFDTGALQWVGERRPHWPRWLNALTLAPEMISMALDLGCTGVAAQWLAIDEAGVVRAREAGMVVTAWTVTDAATYAALDDLGLAAICAEGAALDGTAPGG